MRRSRPAIKPADQARIRAQVQQLERWDGWRTLKEVRRAIDEPQEMRRAVFRAVHELWRTGLLSRRPRAGSGIKEYRPAGSMLE